MITDSFDNRTPAKINLTANPDAVRVDAVIFTFSHVIEEYVVSNFACEKVGALYMAHGSTNVYCFEYNGRKYGFYRTWVGAPACAATVEEICTVLKTDRIIHFGGAGCLNKEIARGKVMIPTAAYRDEGTSYHYAPASDYITVKNADVVAACMAANKIPYAMGKTWTTDAFYRETVGNFEKRKADGCISVEMEGSAVQAVCDFRHLDVYMFFTSGDLLDAPEWTQRRKEGQVKGTQHDTGHFDIALALAEFVSAGK
ncbi:MAG: nucleoside phosphorylase [Clostridia bacterium]|nr:nucleoside phosphorylase [Clostridia bacterium]MBR5985242.1 nucleoside phosphorylase [Clostridia bacterium]MBR6007982.1 nucleoside phosphorylase [Clostridia bacterium]MBR6498768.1 nucleoside phosphorylase [Clostridia bacterium]